MRAGGSGSGWGGSWGTVRGGGGMDWMEMRARREKQKQSPYQTQAKHPLLEQPLVGYGKAQVCGPRFPLTLFSMTRSEGIFGSRLAA